MAEYIKVVFTEPNRRAAVTVTPPFKTWQRASRPGSDRTESTRRARNQILTYQVLPELRQQYPDQTWGFLEWEQFQTQSGEPFQARPRQCQAPRRPGRQTPAPNPTGQLMLFPPPANR